jgi:hypothetical protein
MKVFDEIRNGQTEGESQPKFERLEGCPQCHKSDLSTIVGRQSINGCTAHRCYWSAGLNPFSAPFAEIDAKQREEWNTFDLDNYKQVQPWYLGQKTVAA